MSIKINLAPYFSKIADNNGFLEANGNTVKEAIEDIDNRFPGFKKE
jgi:hypothetical protein